MNTWVIKFTEDGLSKEVIWKANTPKEAGDSFAKSFDDKDFEKISYYQVFRVEATLFGYFVDNNKR